MHYLPRPQSMAVRYYTCRWHSLSKLLSSKRYTSTTWPLLVTNNTSSVQDVDDPQIPLVPKKRDHLAVLKALASTVTPLKDPFLMERSLADPLVPRNRRQMLEFVMAEEAGRKAAMYVMRSYPKLFPAYKRVPDYQRPKRIKGCNENSLKELIRLHRTDRAMKLYSKLKENGNPVSLEVQNMLLALLSHYGVGNSGSSQQSLTINEEDMEELIDSKQDSNVDKQNDSSTAATQANKKVWSKENAAETLFAEMSQKDGNTYGGLIQGLVKFNQFERALELFTEARSNGHQLTVSTYNSILQCIPHIDDTKLWKRTTSILTEMNQHPIVQPNISTIDSLLVIATSTGITSRVYAMEIMREAFELGLKPSLTTFAELVKAFVKHRDHTILYEITDYIENNQDILSVQNPMDTFFFPVAIGCARQLQDPDLAFRLKKLAMKDNWYLVHSIEYFLNNYLATMSFSSDIALFKSEYDSLVPSLCIPREWLYTMFFKQCEAQNLPDVALYLWKSLLKLRVNVKDVMMFHRLAGAFTKQVNPMDIEDYLEAMTQVWQKLNYLKLKPTALIISASIKLLLINGQIDEAWEYYKMFDKYNEKPTFIALVALLKSEYHSDKNPKTVVEIFNLMILHSYILPSNFVRDICVKCNVSAVERNRIMEEFHKNSLKKADSLKKETDWNDQTL